MIISKSELASRLSKLKTHIPVRGSQGLWEWDNDFQSKA